MSQGKSIAIPSVLKIGKGTLDHIGEYLKDADFEQVVIYFGNGLIDMFGMRVMESLKEAGISVREYRELDSVNIEDIITLAFNLPSHVQAIISIGGGKVIDAGKYAAFLRNLPFISVPTSSSSDGFSSASASLLVDGKEPLCRRVWHTALWWIRKSLRLHRKNSFTPASATWFPKSRRFTTGFTKDNRVSACPMT